MTGATRKHVGRAVAVRGDAHRVRLVGRIQHPLSSIRYASGERQTWGINFGRSRRRNLELSFWSGPLDNQWRVSEAGQLTQLSVPAPVDRVQVVPYALAQAQDGVSPNWDAGIDASYAITATTAIYGTLYPDLRPWRPTRSRSISRVSN
jgi:hypothetical protein